MHLGRFHRVIHILNTEIIENDLLAAFDTLISSLASYASSPTATTSNQFQQQLQTLLDILGEAESNNFTPSQKAFVDEISGWQFIGNGLAANIQKIISENNITPASALSDFQTFRKEYDKFVTSISDIDKAFSQLKVEYEMLDEDEGEFGISLPKVAVGETLANLIEETKWLDKLLSAFSELVGEVGKSPKVRTISSSDWQFFIEQSPIVLPAVIFSIERIVALIKSSLEIKVLKQQLENNNLPKEITTQIESHIDSAMKNGIRSIAEDVADQFAKDVDPARLNELKNQLSFGLLTLAKKINEGADVEISAGFPNEPEKIDENTTKAEKEDYAKRVESYEVKKTFALSINSRGISVSNQIVEKMKDQPLLTDYEKSDAPEKP